MPSSEPQSSKVFFPPTRPDGVMEAVTPAGLRVRSLQFKPEFLEKLDLSNPSKVSMYSVDSPDGHFGVAVCVTSKTPEDRLIWDQLRSLHPRDGHKEYTTTKPTSFESREKHTEPQVNRGPSAQSHVRETTDGGVHRQGYVDPRLISSGPREEPVGYHASRQVHEAERTRDQTPQGNRTLGYSDYTGAPGSHGSPGFTLFSQLPDLPIEEPTGSDMYQQGYADADFSGYDLAFGDNLPEVRESIYPDPELCAPGAPDMAFAGPYAPLSNRALTPKSFTELFEYEAYENAPSAVGQKRKHGDVEDDTYVDEKEKGNVGGIEQPYEIDSSSSELDDTPSPSPRRTSTNKTKSTAMPKKFAIDPELEKLVQGFPAKKLKIDHSKRDSRNEYSRVDGDDDDVIYRAADEDEEEEYVYQEPDDSADEDYVD